MVKNCDLTIKFGSLSFKNGKKIRRDTIKMGEHADLTKTWDLINEHWYMIVDVKRKKKQHNKS